MHGKSASENNFSGVGWNFRVFQGIFPGGKQHPGFFRVFQGLLATLLQCQSHGNAYLCDQITYNNIFIYGYISRKGNHGKHGK